MDLEFLLHNNDPTHLHLKGKYKTTVSSVAGASLVGWRWLEGGPESHSGQVTLAQGWGRELSQRVRRPKLFPLCPKAPLSNLVAPSAT